VIASEPAVPISPRHIHAVLDDFTRQEIRNRAEAPRIADDDVKGKAAARKFYEDGMKLRRSRVQVILDNAGNPVIWGNAVLATILSAASGFETYQRYVQGQLSWNVIGWGAGVVSLAASLDYFVSK
jgi:hypothetical protein